MVPVDGDLQLCIFMRLFLHSASFYGHPHLVYFLLHNECEINVPDDQKSTPKMKVVQRFSFSNEGHLTGSNESEIISHLNINHVQVGGS